MFKNLLIFSIAAFSLTGCNFNSVSITSLKSLDLVSSVGPNGSNPTPTSTPYSPTPITPVTSGTMWYIRGDGGSRYSSTANPQGQCNGKQDSAYSGTGVNQPCAYNDVRYLWADGSWNGSWAISGGDTVIIRNSYPSGKTGWRIGRNGPNAVTTDLFNNWPGINALDPYMDYNLPIPAGTASQPTRILGENFANCNAKTQLFGGYAVSYVLNLAGTHDVQVACLELTDHAQCMRAGTPAYPAYCNNNYPLDDFANSGILTDTGTHDILLQDLNVHGFPSTGIFGAIGGTINLNRVRLAYNGSAGWNFDPGNGTTSINHPTVNASYLTIEWSGCNEEYPISHLYPAISCYDDVSGGYGDAVGTPTLEGLNFTCDHCSVNYNTQDGFDLTHSYNSTISFTHSIAIGNMGAGFKFGPQLSETLTNSISMTNCRRMAEPMNGAPSTYNTYLSDFCRGANQVPFNFLSGGNSNVNFEGNTFVGYGATVFDVACLDGPSISHRSSGCESGRITFRDNVVLGYSNPNYNSGQAPGLFFFEDNLSVSSFSVRDYNIYYGVRNSSCPATGFSHESCADPLFLNEPSQTWTSEAMLDSFNFHLSTNSAAAGAGIFLQALPTNYEGVSYSNPPNIGGL